MSEVPSHEREVLKFMNWLKQIPKNCCVHAFGPENHEFDGQNPNTCNSDSSEPTVRTFLRNKQTTSSDRVIDDAMALHRGGRGQGRGRDGAGALVFKIRGSYLAGQAFMPRKMENLILLLIK